MSVTRRSFVRSALTGAAGLGLGATAAGSSLAAGLVRPKRGQFDPPRLSAAVLKATTAECARVRTRAARGLLTSGDVRSLSAGLKVAFAHFEEAGLPEAQEELYRQFRLDALAPVPREDDVARLHQAIVDAGVQMNRDECRRLLSASAERKLAAAAALDRNGVLATYRQVTLRLDRAATHFDASRGGLVRQAAIAAGSQEGECAGLDLLSDMLALLAAVCAAAGMVVPAYLAVAAILEILAQLVGVIGDYGCK